MFFVCFLVCLRVEILLKTDSGYPRDAEVALLTLVDPVFFLSFFIFEDPT